MSQNGKNKQTTTKIKKQKEKQDHDNTKYYQTSLETEVLRLYETGIGN